MPNYDIIPLATDLLDYTIQRVKVKEPQYTKVKAYVMENGQMVEKELFEKIKDDGKPHFPKSQTFHMCADMQRMASAILQKCNSADGRYFETEYEERLKDLDEVIVLCDTLNQYINLSYKRKYISGDQCHYWAELVRPVRQKAFNWKRNDSNRAAALREAKANQELAKMGQMAQQIAEALARNGIDFLGFHTYLTESGKVIRKLRHSSIKRMRAKLRHWEKEYPAGLVTREQILQSWQAWDAHAAHGNTWALRQQVRDRVQNILKEEI